MAAINLHLSILMILLFHSVAVVLVSARVDLNADQGLVDTVCKFSTDNNFCRNILGDNPRTPAANIDGLCVIAVGLTIDHVRNTADYITELLNHIKDPVTRDRLLSCQQKYSAAVSNFEEAWRSALAKSYWNVIDLVRNGTNEGIACQNGFRIEPMRKSPV